MKIKKQKQNKRKLMAFFFYQHKAWSQSEFVSNYQLFVDDDISPEKEVGVNKSQIISMTSKVPKNTGWESYSVQALLQTVIAY